MKLAVVVYGPESCGNRIMTRALIAAGCIGDPDHYQRWEDSWPVDETPIVWFRSMPLGVDHQWPDLNAQMEELEKRGYTVRPLVMVRDWTALARSQVLRQHVATEEAGIANARRAYELIFAAVTGRPFEVVGYGALQMNPDPVLAGIMRRLGLPAPVMSEAVVHADDKHYG